MPIMKAQEAYNEQTLPIDFSTYLRKSDTAMGAVNSYSISFILQFIEIDGTCEHLR